MRFVQNKLGCKFCAFFLTFLIIMMIMVHPTFYNKASAYQNSDYSDEYGDFLYALGESESGNNYSASSGQYFGRWQMGLIGLQDMGFIDSQGNWTDLAGSFGITSIDTFLTSEAGQDYAVLASHKKILLYAENMGITSYINTNVNGVNMTFSGMIAAAHALGVGGLKSLIISGTSGNSGNDSTALRYMEKYGIYDIENTVRNSQTTSGTTTTTTEMTTTTSTMTTVLTTTTATTMTAVSTETTKLKPPSYIFVKPSANVVTVDSMLEISLVSDNADKYHIVLSAPDGSTSEYMLSGDSIGVKISMEGIYTIAVTGYNKAGESYAEPVYVAAKKKIVVDEKNIGDANMDGKVDLMDGNIILQYYSCCVSGIYMNTEGTFNKDYADVNNDGKVDMKDATMVLSYYSRKAVGENVMWSDVL